MRDAVRTARAAAGRRSGKTAGRRRRWRRASNRRSWPFSSKPFAGVGVTDRQNEEAETQGQHEDVQHEMLLAVLVSLRNVRAFSWRANCDNRRIEWRSRPRP